jgi:hypothetical protein
LRSLKFLAGLVGCLTAGASVAQAPAAQTPAPVPVATVDADPALWVVKDADTTIYLFGTIHVLKPGLSWFDEASNWRWRWSSPNRRRCRASS